jgi:hypothetical protein
MAGTMKATAHYCMVRDDEALKIAVRYQMEKQGYSVKAAAELIGVGRYRLTRYLLHPHGAKGPSINQSQLIDLCDKLGIVLSLKITFTKDAK